MKGIPIIVGVTGHRDVIYEDVDEMKITFRKFLDRLQETYKHSEILVASGLARGADIYAVEAAREEFDGKSYDYIAVLPMSRDEYAKDFNSEETHSYLDKTFESELDLYHYMCDNAAILHEGPYYIEEYDDNFRNLCYEAQGKRLADHSDFLVAFLDEDSEVIQGGTKHVIDIRKTGICSHRLNRSELGEMVGGRSTLIIPVRRDSLGVKEPQNRDMNFETILQEASDMVYYDAFNKDFSECKAISKSLERPQGIDQKKSSILDILETLFTHADTLSSHHGKRKQGQLLWMFSMIILAIFSFEIYGVIDWYGFLVIYIAMYIVLMVGYNLILEKKNHHKKHIEYRALAELARVQYYWTLAGMKDQVVDHFPLKSRETLGWIRQALRSVEALTQPEVKDLSPDLESINHVVEYWIRKQCMYYSSRGEKHSHAIKKKEFIYKSGFFIGFLMLVVVVYLSVILKMSSDNIIVLWLVSGSGIIAAVSALYGDRIDMSSFEELTDRYKMMNTAFYKAEEAVKRIDRDEVALHSVLREVGIEVINEISDWFYVQRGKEGKLS